MFYLNVPMAQKDKAKGFGARFDWEKKLWYVPDDIDLEPFKEWVPIEKMQEAEEIIQSQQPEKGIKLSTLLGKVKTAIEENVVGFFWVNTEIADLKEHNGNLYMQLAETNAQGKETCVSRAIIMRDNKEFIEAKFQAETGTKLIKGLKVLMKVKVSYTVKHQMSLIVLDVDPSFTLGGMEAKIKKIRDRIVALNLYDKNKKFIMPDYFKKIAVVSPNEAAGLGDFKADADRLAKYGICDFFYYTATFQGEMTSKTVTKAIKKASFDSIEQKYDAIVVIRGGGAKTDLHFLNEFDIAKAVAESTIPVFVGVGHERDKIFIDEIAFAKFDTPSKVIGFIANNNVKLAKNIRTTLSDVDHFGNTLFKQLKTSINTNNEMIESSVFNIFNSFKSNNDNNLKEIKNLVLKNHSELRMKSEELFSTIKVDINKTKTKYLMDTDMVISEIKLSASRTTKDLQSKVSLEYNDTLSNGKMLLSKIKSNIFQVNSEIDLLSPLNALNNGFAIIKSNEGKIIKSLKELKKESSFVVWMQDGEKEFKSEE